MKTQKVIKKIFGLFMSICLITNMFTNLYVKADEPTIQYSGVSHELTWTIDANGHLLVTGDGDYTENLIDNPTWLKYADEIITAEVAATGLTTTEDMFNGCRYLTSVEFTNTNLEEVTDMSSMFLGCYMLTDVDTEHWNTENVTRMDCMFTLCKELKNIDVSNWTTCRVETMNSMFDYCSNLESIDVKKWDFINAWDLSGMFSGCTSLTELDVKGWNVENVLLMYSLFENCSSLKNIDVSLWNTSQVECCSNMFAGCEVLESIDLSNWNLENIDYIDDMESMFDNCTSLTNIKTPKNLNVTCELPTGNWLDSNWKQHTTFPAGVSYSIELIKSNETPCYAMIDINGYQISTTAEGFRTIYSVSDPQNQIEEVGLVYGLTEYVDNADMVVDSQNERVHTFAATENGVVSIAGLEGENITSYTMTMKYDGCKTEFFTADTMVRVYAKLKDGRYTYSDVKTYTIFDVAEVLYNNSLMSTDVGHNYLYGKILSRVEPNYEPFEYNCHETSYIKPDYSI